jgi:hypothetical protein
MGFAVGGHSGWCKFKSGDRLEEVGMEDMGVQESFMAVLELGEDHGVDHLFSVLLCLVQVKFFPAIR